jgi:hypothetical protein
MGRLTEIGLKHKTDKAYEHSFTEVYEDYFTKYNNPKILEIGVYNGASMETYNEYFNYECTITGIDNGEQLGYASTHPNISIVIADQSRPEELASRVGDAFDIIVDDGSHFVEHQINCFEALKHKVKKGGIYIIEDLHACYHPFYNPNGVTHTVDYLLDLKKNLPSSIKNITIFSDVPLEAATNLSHITSVIEFY